MMLMERREHLFSPDFCVGTPRVLLELIVASFVLSIGYVLLGFRHWRPYLRVFAPIGVRTVEIVSSALLGLGLLWTGYLLSLDRIVGVVTEISAHTSRVK
jgi:hypothetical protein